MGEGYCLEYDNSGYCIASTLFTETTNDMRINRDEILEPVAVHLLDRLALLEALIARRAAQRADMPTRRRLQELASSIHDARDLETCLAPGKTSDQLVEEACHNRFAVRGVAPLRSLSRRFWYAYRQQGDVKEAAQKHAELMEAIAAGDAPAAEEAAHALMDYLEQFTRKVIDSTL